MDAEAISQAAARIVAARDRRAVLGPLPAACRPAGEADGYAVQEAVHRRLAEAGRGEPAGWKLGCTTPVMQDLVGVEGATYGAMAATGLYHGDRSFRLAAFRRPGVECEIAVRLDRRLGPDGAPFDRGAVAGAVGACMVAAEVVDDRYSDFKSIGAPTLIADDFFHAAAVLGRPVEDWRGLDLAAVAGRTLVDGREAGRGVGADALGHPLDALAWLADRLAARGRGLRPGEVVLTGSLVATQWLAGPAVVEVEIEALGRLRLGFD
jgi:2-oxo-3-hexenedioate decarboxylase/2-keto-4-pentenoate hydratase